MTPGIVAGQAAGNPIDAYWDSVVLRATFDVNTHLDLSQWSRPTQFGTVTLGTGKFGSALDASGNPARYTFSPAYNAPVSITVEGWAKCSAGMPASLGHGPLWATGMASGAEPLLEVYNNGSQRVLRFCPSNGALGAGYHYTSGHPDLGDDTWFHWCLEKVGTTTTAGNYYVYINGVKRLTIIGAGGMPIWFGGASHFFVGLRESTNTKFPGVIDDFRMTEVARYGGVDFTPPTGPYPTTGPISHVTTSAFSDLGSTYNSNSWTLPAVSASAGQTVFLFVSGFGTTGAPTVSTPVGWGTHYNAVDGSGNNQRIVCFYRTGAFASTTPALVWNVVTQGLVMSVTLTGATTFSVYGPDVQLGFAAYQRTLQTVASVPPGAARIDHLMTCFYRAMTWAATVQQEGTHYSYTSGATGGIGQGASVKTGNHLVLGNNSGNLITMTDPDAGAPESPSNGYVIIAKK